MGWAFTSSYQGGGVRRYLDRQFTCDNDAGKWEILDSALVGMRHYYAALRYTDKRNEKVRILGMCVLVKHVPSARDGYTLGWKEMTECMGPYQYDCPLRLLNLLDPPEDENAREWREKVRIYHARRKARPRPGDTVVFAAPLSFTDGSQESRFKAERIGKRKVRYRSLSTGGLYRIGKIEQLDFTVETSAD